MARALACAALVVGTEAVRLGRQVSQVKHIAGVPIYNYDQAYGGEHALLEDGSEMEENWIVMTNEDASDEAISTLCQTSNCKDMGHPEEGGVPFFEVRCSERELEKVILQGDGVVSFIEPDLPVYALEVESDGESQESQARTWGLNKIGADSRSNTGKNVNIYVLDTGVRTTHTEFSGRAVTALDYSSDRRVVCSGRLSCAVDRQGHGTHCAGTAAGAQYGVAPGAKVHGIKVLGDDGRGSSSWGIGSLDWVGTSGKRPAVASMSLGGKGVSSSYDRAVTGAVNRGVVVVVAAGNSNDDACGYRPAHSSAAITVGSTTSWDARSSFSNYGRCVNIWAPGSSIKSAYYRDNSDTTSLSGTSMACPHVSGAAALILSSSPGNSPSKVRSKLLDNARRGRISGLKSGDTNAFLYIGR